MQKVATVLIAASLIILPSLVLAKPVESGAIENATKRYV